MMVIMKSGELEMSRTTKAQSQAVRERIVEEAAKSFRQHGLDGIGVADVMKRAGLTHGGFYVHFASKDELKAEACRKAVDVMLEQWGAIAEGGRGKPLSALVDHYLSPEHRDHPETGCLLAALGPEISRQPEEVRGAVTEQYARVVAFLAGIAPGRTAAAKRRNAVATFTSILGGVVIARALNDSALAAEALRAAESVHRLAGKA